MTDSIYPNYANGYHELWEVRLHERRKSARDAGRELSPQEELNALEQIVTAFGKTATGHIVCDVCQEEIAQAMLEGRDPFKIPDAARSVLEDVLVSLRKRR
jgi:hypothetical protein